MSQIEQRICDQCETYAETPPFKSKGWIHFRDVTFVFSTGQAYLNKDISNLDFCSIKCFYKWLEKQSK